MISTCYWEVFSFQLLSPKQPTSESEIIRNFCNKQYHYPNLKFNITSTNLKATSRLRYFPPNDGSHKLYDRYPIIFQLLYNSLELFVRRLMQCLTVNIKLLYLTFVFGERENFDYYFNFAQVEQRMFLKLAWCNTVLVRVCADFQVKMDVFLSSKELLIRLSLG